MEKKTEIPDDVQYHLLVADTSFQITYHMINSNLSQFIYNSFKLKIASTFIFFMSKCSRNTDLFDAKTSRRH